jgi:hypothetical protein
MLGFKRRSFASLIDNFQLSIVNFEMFARLRLGRLSHYQLAINNYQFRLASVLILSAVLALPSCTERSTSFEIEPIEIGVADDAKTRAKRQRQFLQTLYNHIYQAPLPPSDAVALDELLRSIGDSQLAIEVVVAKMVADPNADLPSLTEMRNDPETFISDLYRRLYVRDATAAEKSWWVNYLETHPDVDVAQVVFSFITANEYRYY